MIKAAEQTSPAITALFMISRRGLSRQEERISKKSRHAGQVPEQVGFFFFLICVVCELQSLDRLEDDRRSPQMKRRYGNWQQKRGKLHSVVF